MSDHSHDAHGHGSENQGDIIPETSIQDKLLVLMAGICLVSLLFYGFQWGLGAGI